MNEPMSTLREELAQYPGSIPESFVDTDGTGWSVREASEDGECEYCPRPAAVEMRSYGDDEGGGGPTLCAECAAGFYVWLIGKGPRPFCDSCGEARCSCAGTAEHELGAAR